MKTYTGEIKSADHCAFCGKQLSISNGELECWRTPRGEFFCNEFCADDAEEVHFLSHGHAAAKGTRASLSSEP